MILILVLRDFDVPIVSKKGVVKGICPGKVKITARVNGKSVTCRVNVKRKGWRDLSLYFGKKLMTVAKAIGFKKPKIKYSHMVKGV